MQRVVNYGSFLQAYALKKTLESLGGEVSFVDILPGKPLPGFEWDRLARVRSAVRTAWRALQDGGLAHRVRSRLFVERLRRQFESQFHAMLDQDACKPNQYDLVVIGSDEVFNITQHASWGFTPQLFGAGLPAKSTVSYAGSFGNTTLGDIDNFGVRDSIAAALANLSRVSVRDGNSHRIVKDLTGRDADLHLDPVLTFDWSPLVSHPSSDGDAIVVYAYPNRIAPDEARRIKAFAGRRKKRLVSIGAHYDWCDEVLLPRTPFEVLDHFRSADSIVTDTFHGSIFSIVSRKRFSVLIRPSNRAKLGYLLSQLHLDDRAAVDADDIERALVRTPDYERTYQVIAEKKASADAYWSTCLGRPAST